MSFPTPPARTPKGQLKCFQCRQTLLLKDGSWHEHGNQQVFLCKVCEKADVKPEKKSGFVSMTARQAK